MKSETEIENELTSLQEVVLPITDKADIKASLLEKASQSLSSKTIIKPIISPFNSWLTRAAVSFASLVLIFAGTTYASKDSLPGEPLYLLKINVLEEAISFSKIEPKEHTAYEITRMENRLLELKALNTSTGEISNESLEDLAEQIDEHISDIDSTFKSDEGISIGRREKIDTLSKLSGIVKAQEKITDNNLKFVSVSEDIENAEIDTDNILEANINAFTKEESPESVNQYISDEISEIETDILATTTSDLERELYKKNLLDLEEAIIDNDFPEAIITILEAEQESAIEEYLTEGEIVE